MANSFRQLKPLFSFSIIAALFITLVVPLMTIFSTVSAAPANVLVPTNVDEYNSLANDDTKLEEPTFSGDKLILNNDANGTSLGDFTFNNGVYLATEDPDITALFGCTGSFNQYILVTTIVPNDVTTQDGINKAFTGTDYKNDASDYTRAKGSPYVVIQCRNTTTRQYGGDTVVYGNSLITWTRYLIADAATSISLDSGSAIGVPAGTDNGKKWADYRGNLTDTDKVGAGGSRFRAISPYEIVDTTIRYPGGKYVTYAITEGTNWGGGDQQRLFNDGINIYWPLKESALTKKTYTESDYDFKTSDGLCRGGFSIKTGGPDDDNLKYGRIYAVPTKTANGICTVLTGSAEISYNTAFGHFDDGDYPNDFDFALREWIITKNMYATQQAMSAWYAHFYWIDGSSIGAYRRSTPVLITKWPGNDGDQGAVLSTIGQTGANMEVWTSTACTPATGTPDAFLLINRDRNATLTDIQTNSTSATATVYFKRDGAFVAGWNDEQVRCLVGEKVEENGAGYLEEWNATAASGGSYADEIEGLGKSRVAFISYPSRSVNNVDGSNSSQENGQIPDDAVGSDGGGIVPSCESSGGFNLSWILCPIINGLTSLSQGIFTTVIEPFLRTEPIATTNTASNTTYAIWVNFRTLGNILLIFGLLFIVFGQSIGGGLVDAYTAKKAMPRLLVVAVLINLSIFIAAILVDITNVIGAGIGSLIVAPVKSIENGNGLDFTVGSGTAGTVLAVAGTAGLAYWLFDKIQSYRYDVKNPVLGPPRPDGLGSSSTSELGGSFIPMILLFVLLPIAIVTISIFATLIIRRGLILFLIIVSPVALALYILPQTEKYAKKWFDTFVKTLMVYPIIVAIFSLAYVLSITIINANDGFSEGAFSQFLAKIIGIIVLFVPLFMIPFAFKLAGGAVATLYGALNGFGKKNSERLMGDARDQNSLRNRVKRQAGEKFTRTRANFAHANRNLDTRRRLSPTRRLLGRLADIGDVDQKLSTYNAEAAERKERLQKTGDDSLIYAGAGWHQATNEYNPDGSLRYEAGKFYNGKGDEISQQEYRKGKQLHGTGIAALGQSLEYRLRKVQNDDDLQTFREAFIKNAVANNWNQKEAASVWAAATYPHKDKFATEWYSSPVISQDANGRTTGVRFNDVSSDERSYNKWANDKHKTQQSFQLGSLRDVEIRAMADRYEQYSQILDAGGTLDATQAQNFAMTSELFDTMVVKGMIQYDGEGNPQASGVSAASKSALETAFRNRRYKAQSSGAAGASSGVTYRTDPATGRTVTVPGTLSQESINERDIIRIDNRQIVQTNIPVMGDVERSNLPRSGS